MLGASAAHTQCSRLEASAKNTQMISVLFTQKNSIYEKLGMDCWGIERNALNWPGGNAIIAHPPCRSWGNYAHLAKPRPGEKDLAVWAIGQVRQWGGILEHPKRSKLWPTYLPEPGQEPDQFGGWTLYINQHWFGHKAQKSTYLYIVGIEPGQIPEYPINLNAITGSVRNMNKKQREHTPVNLAKWLIQTATLIGEQKLLTLT